MALRMIQVGTGGMGATWCRDFLPPHVAAGLIEVVAAVDTNPEVLGTAREHLGLAEAQCYTDIRRAFDENPADFCTVVVPPYSHEAKSWIRPWRMTCTSFRRSRSRTRWWRRCGLPTR